jgi:2,3,4,5-tetrahydropyridine-2-carboxylate N-succinyltransferase
MMKHGQLAADTFTSFKLDGDESSLVEADVCLEGRVSLGPRTWLRSRTRLRDSQVGEGVFTGFRVSIEDARVDDGVMLATQARVEGAAAGYSLVDRRETVLSRGSWIGARALVRNGVTVGEGAVVAAAAIVEDDVSADTLVAGRPARPLRLLSRLNDGFPDISATVSLVRARAARGDGARLGIDAAALCADWPDTASWTLGAHGIYDAELGGGRDVVIGDNAIVIGRSAAHGGVVPNGGVQIGPGSRIGRGVTLEGTGGIRIGAGCAVEDDVLVLSSGHALDRTSMPWVPTPVRIGVGVTIGAGATLIGPLSLGDRASVAPGAVVIRDVAAGDTSEGVFGRRA